MAIPTPEEIKKDGKLCVALIKFGKKEYTQENILYYFDKGNMAGVHPKYIADRSPRMVNVSSNTRAKMQKAFDENNEKEWTKWNKQGKSEIYKLLSGIIGRFILTETYIRIMAKKKLAKAVKILGIDAKHKEAIVDVMVAYKMKGASLAKKKLGPLLKKAKMDVEVEKVLANLKKVGL